MLEYFPGVLFLTTSRAGDLDEAVASRIHMSLYYPKLDLDKTREIFKVNLDLIRERFEKQGRKDAVVFEDQVILDFAERHYTENAPVRQRRLRWDGRQIRNACQTALAMAELEAYENPASIEVEPTETSPGGLVHLKLEHFETIEKAYDEFAGHLGDIYGADTDGQAADAGVQANEKSSLRAVPEEPANDAAAAGSINDSPRARQARNPAGEQGSARESFMTGDSKLPINQLARKSTNPAQSDGQSEAGQEPRKQSSLLTQEPLQQQPASNAPAPAPTTPRQERPAGTDNAATTPASKASKRSLWRLSSIRS